MHPTSLKLIQAIIFMVCLMFQVDLVSAKECIQREKQALLDFKAGLVDRHGMLSSWITEDCCQWKGIRCSNLTGHVLMLDLHGHQFIDHEDDTIYYYISGEIHKSLIELQHLKYLNLSGNIFEDIHIPDFFGSLSNLRYLDLSDSEFGGKIPSQFGSLSHLKYLNLGLNDLEGSIPYQLGNLTNLQFLSLKGNSLIGNIPSQLGKLSKLQELYLGGYGALKIDDGNLSGGQGKWLSNLTSLTHLQLWWISDLNSSHSWLQMIGKLPKLRELSLPGCTLSDHFILSLSTSIFNFSTSLSVLDLSSNSFSSSVIFQWVSNFSSNLVELDLSRNLMMDPPSNHFATEMISKLPKLRKLWLYDCLLSDDFLLSQTASNFNSSTSLSILDLSSNSFTSSMIFQWVSNISSNLVELDLSENQLVAHASNDSIVVMNSLERLFLGNNRLKGRVLKSFVNICTLRELSMYGNNLTEDLPSVLDNLSGGCVRNSLQELYLRYNKITGSLPDLFMFSSLKTLDLSYNRLTGSLPDLSMFASLKTLDLSFNRLTGSLPDLSMFSSLKTLDLSLNRLTGSLPDLSMFSSLKTLDLSLNRLTGKIPEGIKLPSQLESLSIRSNSFEGRIPKSFGNACALRSLDMSNNSLSEELPVIIHHLSGCARYSLQELDLSMNQINGTLPDLSMFSSLKTLDLSLNRLTGSLPDLSMFSSLKTLDLSPNRLTGKIPEGIKLPSQLESLSIRSNSFEGRIPKSFGNACALSSLDMSNNSLSEELPVIIRHLSGCARYSLQELYLSMNQINGTLPDLSIFSSLKRLDLSENRLYGKISEGIQFPTQLEELFMNSNSLNGVFSDSHFANMSKLDSLDLSDNSLALTFTQNWIPPFQLGNIGLGSCKLGSAFPRWLQTQDNFQSLDISNAGISDIVPEWFWAKLALQDWGTINISHNNLKGVIPNYPLRNTYFSISLASNQFEGPIPPFLRGALFLDLSKNRFSDSHSFLCTIGAVKTLYQLDLSSNQFHGQIPDCWIRFKSLAYLNLSHNNFSGKIPTSMGTLLELQALLLRNNSLTEEIPFSLMNCTKLVMLDAGENRLSGLIPSWIGSKLHELQVLTLGRNHFSGSLPLELCYLKSIQLLDLSLNNLSGQIPKCFKNFTSMAQKTSLRDYAGHQYFINTSRISTNWSFDLNAFLMWKGVERMFKNNGLVLLKSIDLSSNQFSEEIPAEIGNLFELVSLNLSRNNLTGEIPSNIVKLASLDSLDFSRNQLIGSIRSSLTRIDRLTMLDLSHNYLSGKIPTSTQLQSFNSSSYEDNFDLCGPPLEKLCTEGEPLHEPIDKIQEDEDLFLTSGFYISMAFGFVVGFWGVFGSILVKRSWRHAYFKFLNCLMDSIYVLVTVKSAGDDSKTSRWMVVKVHHQDLQSLGGFIFMDSDLYHILPVGLCGGFASLHGLLGDQMNVISRVGCKTSRMELFSHVLCCLMG